MTNATDGALTGAPMVWKSGGTRTIPVPKPAPDDLPSSFAASFTVSILRTSSGGIFLAFSQNDPYVIRGASSVVCALVPNFPANCFVETNMTVLLKGVRSYPATFDRT